MNETRKSRRIPAVDLAYQLGISDRTLHRWVHDPKLNFPKPIVVNRRRYFSEADIAAWEALHLAGVGQEVA